MALRPAKHEKVAAFSKKNERISNVFRILGVRNTEKSEGIKGSNTFDPNIL